MSGSEFKNAMSSLAFQVAIVTACAEGERLGRTVTSFTSLSADPARMIVSIDSHSRIIDLIGTTKTFSMAFLSTSHQTIAEAFAGKVPQEERFNLSKWDHWPNGNLKLPGATLALDCELIGSVDAGDHMLFFGAIIEAEVVHGQVPLIWNNRAYGFPSSLQK